MTVRFGKYAGWRLEDVPLDYVDWMIGKCKHDLAMWEGERQRRELLEEAELTMVEQLVKAGFRELAKRHHPDYGGSATAMQELNAAHEWLKEALRGHTQRGSP